MKYLVTGGLGFIGWNLVNKLADEGHLVKVIDNLMSGFERPMREGVTYRITCCSNIDVLCDFNPDYVIHLGEYSRVQQSFDEPLNAMENITSTLPYVLDYCRQNKAKLLYAGSSTKYGKARSPYSICKETNTILVDKFCQLYDMDYAITYFYNAYGINECFEGVYSTAVAKFLHAKKLGLPVKIYGDGLQRRNFTDVRDIVSGILRVADSGYGDGYGIGSDEDYSVLELVNMIGNNHTLIPDVAGNRTQAALCTDKTKALGWVARNKLQEYIKECVI